MLAAASANRYGRRASFRPTEEDPMLFIRVQRRRAVTAAATIRVGLDAASATVAALADVSLNHRSGSVDLNDSTTSLNASFFKRDFNPSTALFRRVEEFDPVMRRCSSQILQDAVPSTLTSYGMGHNSAKRNCIVDAILVEDEDDSREVCNNKRRKVTLQLLDSPHDDSFNPTSFQLTAEQSAIDTSLQRVFQGAHSVRIHCDMLKQLSPSTSAGYTAWTWGHSTSGNWLHAAALWDDHNVIQECLSWLQSKQEGLPSISPKNVISCLLQALDGDGHTPFTVAQESGHSAVVEVLASYGAQPQKDHSTNENQDDDSIMYDIYCLVPPNSANTIVGDTTETSQANVVLDCELQNGCMGYWNNQGELVLDHSSSYGEDVIDEECDEANEDSNDEGCQGNDYPDDEDSCDDFSYGSSNEYRNRPVNVRSAISEDSDYDYDPTYSGILGQGSLDYDSSC